PQRHYDWFYDPNYFELIETIGALRSEFLGIDTVRLASLAAPVLNLTRNCSIDGLAHVGKTTIAMHLGQMAGRPVMDTGLIFRGFALAQMKAESMPTIEKLQAIVIGADGIAFARSAEVSEKAGTLARDPHYRSLYEKAVRG